MGRSSPRSGGIPAVVFAAMAAVIVVAGAHAGDFPDAPNGAALTADAAVAIALRDNPGLDELSRRAQAAAAVPSQAGSLPDPRINVGALNLPVDTFALDQEPMTQLQVGLSQTFPFPGKLDLRRDIAQFQADAAGDSLNEGRLRLERDVRKTWWELFYLDRAAGTIARNRKLLGDLVDVARVKYEVGRGLQQDVLLAQVELARMQDMAIQVDGMRTPAAARLNALLARTPRAPLVLPDTSDTSLPVVDSPAQLEALAEQARPWLAKIRHSLDAARSAEELAGKEYLPDLGVSANYGFRHGYNVDGSRRANFASIMFSVSIPLFAGAKQDQLVVQRSREAAAEEDRLIDARNQVHADIASAVADYERARDELALLDDGILPQTRQAVASMLAGYQVSKIDFLTLVRTQVTLYNHELQRWRALSQAWQALATLDAAVGRENLHD